MKSQALLRAKLKQIHQGYYPKEELKILANEGLFASLHEQSAAKFNEKSGLYEACEKVAQISEICGNTGFCVWCQYTLIWYLKNCENETLKAKFLPLFSSGELLGATGLSNGAKALAGIEKNFVKGVRTEGGYLLNGTLPWVSNLGEDHYFAFLFELENEKNDEKIFAFVDCKRLELSDKIHFCALEGSATKSVGFRDYFLPDDEVIALDGVKFFERVVKGFLLLQCAMGLGLCKHSLQLICKNGKCDKKFLSLQENELEEQISRLELELKNFCQNETTKPFRAVLEYRLRVAELSLESAKFAMLHQSSTGYLKDSIASKHLLECYFMGIVTPSIKHLNMLLKDMYEI